MTSNLKDKNNKYFAVDSSTVSILDVDNVLDWPSPEYYSIPDLNVFLDVMAEQGDPRFRDHVKNLAASKMRLHIWRLLMENARSGTWPLRADFSLAALELASKPCIEAGRQFAWKVPNANVLAVDPEVLSVATAEMQKVYHRFYVGTASHGVAKSQLEGLVVMTAAGIWMSYLQAYAVCLKSQALHMLEGSAQQKADALLEWAAQFQAVDAPVPVYCVLWQYANNASGWVLKTKRDKDKTPVQNARNAAWDLASVMYRANLVLYPGPWKDVVYLTGDRELAAYASVIKATSVEEAEPELLSSQVHSLGLQNLRPGASKLLLKMDAPKQKIDGKWYDVASMLNKPSSFINTDAAQKGLLAEINALERELQPMVAAV
jgi:hypothetical protein